MIVYRLTQENHRRIAKLANWFQVGPDLLLKKMVELQLCNLETVYDEVEFLQEKQKKYEAAGTLQLLEP